MKNDKLTYVMSKSMWIDLIVNPTPPAPKLLPTRMATASDRSMFAK